MRNVTSRWSCTWVLSLLVGPIVWPLAASQAADETAAAPACTEAPQFVELFNGRARTACWFAAASRLA
ncbi:MAG: hypothetical protein MUE50_23490 [Pirellulaceae bacterium]|nr:hypothetical protein [Pirellulaceae bacterium]